MNSKQTIQERKANINMLSLNSLLSQSLAGKQISKKVKADITKAWKENDETDRELMDRFDNETEWMDTIDCGDLDHLDMQAIPDRYNPVSNLQDSEIPF